MLFKQSSSRNRVGALDGENAAEVEVEEEKGFEEVGSGRSN
jgi:hypothetical protein